MMDISIEEDKVSKYCVYSSTTKKKTGNCRRQNTRPE
jgi:hypothetical protein